MVVRRSIPMTTRLEDSDNTRVLVRSNGKVEWYPPLKLTMSTELDMTYFPFDSHNVTIDFDSWLYDEYKLKLTALMTRLEKSVFVPSEVWNLEDTYAYTSTLNIPGYNQWSSFKATILISRRPKYFVVNIVVPLIALSFLTHMVFLLPTESGEKISLSITVLVTCSVFQLLLADNIPKTSKTPIIVVYLSCMVMMLIFSVAVSVCVIRIFYKNDYAVPDWLRKFSGVIGPIVCGTGYRKSCEVVEKPEQEEMMPENHDWIRVARWQ
ncbi:acetylcholine receptor subunit alpha-1-B-like [Tubulanus polymorphus]|uniref:acetylcholine receptor subunit alpha-1-B-like n=1 Tax=Tubulanus polymorphus TaxID=672921 RepID=UPI003DA5ABCF